LFFVLAINLDFHLNYNYLLALLKFQNFDNLDYQNLAMGCQNLENAKERIDQ